MCLSAIDVELKRLINKKAKDWEEGEKRVFCFSCSELGFKDEPTEDELEQVGTELKYIEDIQLGEDGDIMVTVSERHLCQTSESQLRDWVEESDLKQLGRYESCGWI